MAILAMIKQLSENVAKSLPGFWRIAKACMDGKYRKVCRLYLTSSSELTAQRESSTSLSTNHRPASAPKSMALDIVKTYITLLSQFFTLSDVAIAEAAIKREGEDPPVPPFVPVGTTVIASGHYGEKVVDEVTECAGDLLAVDVSGEASTSLKGLLDSLRWRFEEVLAATWARGQFTLAWQLSIEADCQMPDCCIIWKIGTRPLPRDRFVTWA
jgi:exocyst complex component 2